MVRFLKVQIKSRRDQGLIFKITVCSLGILLRQLSERTCQIVEEHSWQNLSIFRQEPKCAYDVPTPAEGEVVFAIQGLRLGRSPNYEAEKIFKFYYFFWIFGLLQNSGVEPADLPNLFNDYKQINFEGATYGPQCAGHFGTVRASRA
jgi:hypothetical protein